MFSQATIFCGCRVSVYKQCWKTIRAKAMLSIPFLSGTVNSSKTLALLSLMNSTECRRCQPPQPDTPINDFFIITEETLFLRRRIQLTQIVTLFTQNWHFSASARSTSSMQCFFTSGSGSGIWGEGPWFRIPAYFSRKYPYPAIFSSLSQIPLLFPKTIKYNRIVACENIRFSTLLRRPQQRRERRKRCFRRLIE